MTKELTERQKREKTIYDELAKEAEIVTVGEKFPLPNREHADFFPYFLKQIGEVKNKRILEIGSGPGYLSCWLAKKGAYVTGIDISEKFVEIAKRTAKKNHLDKNTKFLVSAAENLPFNDSSFDIIVGNQILHHLEIPEVAKEMKRVLKNEGKAVFCEPIGFSKIMEKLKEFYKKTTKHKDHRHTPDERIIDKKDFAIIKAPFRKTTTRGFQLISTKLTRILALPNFIYYPVMKIDGLLLRFIPFLKNFARLIVIVLYK